MSNEIISVPRELLERACAVRNTANGCALSADAIRELRTLLAKPAAEPDPIIAVLKSNLADGVMPSFSGGDLKHLIKLLEAAPEPAAQHQGEPAAIYQAEYRGDGGGGWSDVEYREFKAYLSNPEFNTRIVYTRPAEQHAPDGFEVARHSKRLVEQLRERIAELEQPAPVTWLDLEKAARGMAYATSVQVSDKQTALVPLDPKRINPGAKPCKT